MNVLEASDLIDRAIALGCWPTATPDLLAEQAEAWASALSEVPLAYALQVVEHHPPPYMIKPSQIRGKYEDDQRSIARRNQGPNERACGLGRLCSCSHAPGVCYRGFVDAERVETQRTIGETRDGRPIERYGLAAVWCPTCWDAKNARRGELKKDPIEVGEVGPNA